jgi:GNAT superfamily N-acetyltransferase
MLTFREVTTELADAEIVRTIRNSGREWMTRDTRHIDPIEQAAWWAKRDPARCRIWVARLSATDVGYGLLRREGDRVWASLAVLPQFRGQGFGAAIYRWLALATPEQVWAEILADNTPSIRACLRAGYQIAYAQDKIATLVYRK